MVLSEELSPNTKSNKKHQENDDSTVVNCDLKQFLCFLGFLLIIGVNHLFYPFLKTYSPYIPLVVRFSIGIPFIIGAIWIIVWGIRTIYGSNTPTTEIIEKGPYCISRHPMYFGALLIYIGCLFLSSSLISGLYLIFVFWLYNRFATFEELYLLKLHGHRYQLYKNRVMKWFGKRK